MEYKKSKIYFDKIYFDKKIQEDISQKSLDNKAKDILDKTYAISKIIMSYDNSAENFDKIEVDILYTIEDNAYYYAYCLQVGLCGYGNSIAEANEALIQSVQNHFITFYKNNQKDDYFRFAYSWEYFLAFQMAKMNIDKENTNSIMDHIDTNVKTEVFEESQTKISSYFGKKISKPENRISIETAAIYYFIGRNMVA